MTSSDIIESSLLYRETRTWRQADFASSLSRLIIFDNADDLDVLRHVWPSNGNGSVLITTRDASAIYSPASGGFHVQPFDDASGSQVLLNIVGLDPNSSTNQENAISITKALGGLPLAINQISGFIVQRKLKLQDFLPLYERNSAKIDARKTGISGYEHTLSTVWEMSISKLTGNSRTLLSILPYFQPDGIDETVLLQGANLLDNPDFEFLQDEMEYVMSPPSALRALLTIGSSIGDAEEILLKAGLVDKNPETALISVHRLVQAVIVRSQSQEERSQCFDATVQMLSWGFPDTWSEDVGHQFQAWSNCEKCLSHVHHLVALRKRSEVTLNNPQRYGELLLRCSW